jgi:hypothetical protein
MLNLPRFNASMLILVLGFSAGSAVAAFSCPMTPAALKAEVTSELATQSLQQIAQAAKAAGCISAADLTTAMINDGQDPAVVVYAVINVFGNDSKDAVVDAALSIPGVDREAVLAAAGGRGTLAALAYLADLPPTVVGAGGGGGGGVASPH